MLLFSWISCDCPVFVCHRDSNDWCVSLKGRAHCFLCVVSVCSLEVTLQKRSEGPLWPELVMGDRRGELVMSDEQAALIHERLTHLTSEDLVRHGLSTLGLFTCLFSHKLPHQTLLKSADVLYFKHVFFPQSPLNVRFSSSQRPPGSFSLVCLTTFVATTSHPSLISSEPTLDPGKPRLLHVNKCKTSVVRACVFFSVLLPDR